jgi:hypothetical protein
MEGKNTALLFITVIFLSIAPKLSIAQSDSTGTFWKPTPRNYEVKQAVEIETLFPMFFYGGWHIGLGYRYKKFRFRVSVINGGDYNVDVQSLDGTIDGYKRYYTTSPGIFLGRTFYIQPGIHSYFRSEQSTTFTNNQTYTIPTFELTPIVRIGARLWKKY